MSTLSSLIPASRPGEYFVGCPGQQTEFLCCKNNKAQKSNQTHKYINVVRITNLQDTLNSFDINHNNNKNNAQCFKFET